MDRTDQEVICNVMISYYSVLLAMKHVEVAQQALQTAEAVVESSKNRYESGIVVEPDYLSSQVRLGMRKQEFITAQNELELARAELSTSIGMPIETRLEPADALAVKSLPGISLEDAENTAVKKRPDLSSIRSDETAQQLSTSIAKSSFGPRLDAFGDWETDNPTFLAGGGGKGWLAGIELQFDLFQGGAKRAQLAREKAREGKIAAAREMATDAVRLEARRAYYEVETAQQHIEVARASIAEAQKSLQINQNRYDAGLSTIADLLAAEEAARRSQTDYWDAVCQYLAGYANLELARGTLSPQSPVVSP